MHTLVCPIGLGDSIVMAGAAVVLAERYGALRVPAHRRYMESVQSFYVNHPEIEVYPVDNERKGFHWGRPMIEDFKIVGEPIMCGHYLEWPDALEQSFTQWMYAQLGVDYRHRWDACPIPKACLKVEQIEIEPKVLAHEDVSRGFTILKSITDGAYRLEFGNKSVLEHAYAIQHAREIHCIDSSIYHLVECLETRAELYLHRYARCYRKIWFDFPSRKSWRVVTRRSKDWKERSKWMS